MTRTGVMQMVDTLDAGGAERVAVNLANFLPRDRYRAFLCTTRREGALEPLIREDVAQLKLHRKRTLDVGAIRGLVQFIRENEIEVLHPHGASIFMAAIAATLAPNVRVIWHDHFGRCGTEERPAWLYGLAAKKVDGVIAVNDALAEWSRGELKIPVNRVWYVPNFVDMSASRGEAKDLPGTRGLRIVCVANFRPQKDHVNLIRAMGAVVRQVAGAHLLLVAPVTESAHEAAIRSEITAQGIAGNVSFLGSRTDVADVLRQCDVGVLASVSEGLPLSLLEYGAAGLAAVATNVGQCAEVLNGGAAGLLVPPSNPEKLAEALISLLASSERRRMFGERFRHRVAEAYSAEAAMQQVCHAYDVVMGRQSVLSEESSAVTVSAN